MARTSILGPLAFTASNGTALETYDTNWTPISGGGGDGGFLLIQGNKLVLGFGVSPRIRFRNTRTYAADQWIGGTISGLAAGLSAVAFLLRMSGDVSPNDDWYAVEIDPTVSPISTTILKCVNGSVSTLASSTSISWASGDTVEFEAIGSGGSVELKVYRNGGTSTVLTHTDSTSPLTSGKPGIAFRGPGIGGGFYGTEVDGLDGGDVTSSDTTPPTITGPTGSAGAASISVNVVENTTAVGDWNANETVTWSISGPDAALFTINSSTGVLAFISAPDFEAPGDAGANNTYDLTVTATDTASPTPNVSTQTVAVNVTDAAEDATNPSAPGTPTFASVTKTAATVNYTAATDNVAVAGYERRVASGSIVDVGNALTFNLTGGTPGSSVLVEVRAYDAAGNRGAWSSATLTYLIYGIDFDDPALGLEIGDFTGTQVGLGLSNAEDWLVRIRDANTGAQVHSATVTTNSVGVLSRLQHASLDAAVYEVTGQSTETDPLDRRIWSILIEATTP